MSANPDPNPKSGLLAKNSNSSKIEPDETYSYLTDTDDSIPTSEIGNGTAMPKDDTPDHGDASELADLIGFDRKPEIADATQGLMASDEAESNKTELPLYANPYVKFPLLIAFGAIVVGVVGSFFLGGGSDEAPKVAAKSDTPVATTVFEDNSDGKAKAELALSKEMNAGKSATVAATVPGKPSQVNPATAEVPIQPAPVVKPATPASAPVTPTTQSAPAIKKAEPMAVRPAPAITQVAYPAPKPQPIINFDRVATAPKAVINPPVIKLPVIKPTPTPKLSPKTVVAMNKYPPIHPIATALPRIEAVDLSWDKVSAINSSYGGNYERSAVDNKVADKNSTATPSVAKKAPVNSAGEAGVLSGIPPKAPIGTIPVGRSVSGTLVTPIQLLAGKDNEATATIQINKPLIATNGNILMLPGAQITFKLTLTSDNGYLAGTATQASIRGATFDLPPRTISLQSASNRALVAENYQFGTDTIRDRDALSFFYSAAANVGSVLTAPTQQTSNTSSSNGGFSSSNSTTSNPNVIGAILQGGFNPLATAIQERNAIEIGNILKGTRLWQLPVGTPVQINVINQFSL
jgi:hypothetical protein